MASDLSLLNAGDMVNGLVADVGDVLANISQLITRSNLHESRMQTEEAATISYGTRLTSLESFETTAAAQIAVLEQTSYTGTAVVTTAAYTLVADGDHFISFISVNNHSALTCPDPDDFSVGERFVLVNGGSANRSDLLTTITTKLSGGAAGTFYYANRDQIITAMVGQDSSGNNTWEVGVSERGPMGTGSLDYAAASGGGSTNVIDAQGRYPWHIPFIAINAYPASTADDQDWELWDADIVGNCEIAIRVVKDGIRGQINLNQHDNQGGALIDSVDDGDATAETWFYLRCIKGIGWTVIS